ncbi:MAG: UbiA family prenyltransferase [Anaerolineae bacterium]|nr:UbiA family prenyltransferase [Anaerolineae bacterium]
MERTLARQVARTRLADYWSLIKFPQTALLLITAFCAYLLTHGLPADLPQVAGMAAALFLSVGGCTALNMVLDRDIDARMGRTASRPLAGGRIRPLSGALFGGALSAVGLALAFALDVRFGGVVAAGFLFDLLVYTAWLKRRTPLSIVFGGVAGGMPVLAGRVLALGRIDWVGVLIAASILLWIPSHILTLALRYADDYRRAGVPTWPIVYGVAPTRAFIAVANLLNVGVLTACGLLLRINALALALLLALSCGMVVLAVRQLVAPTERGNWRLFKLASIYMLASSLLLTVGVLV